MPKDKPISLMAARFVDEYLVDLNATQAAIRAGYSKRTAASQGQRLLSHKGVAAAIQAAQEDLSKRTGVTQEAVLGELMKIAFSDLREVFGPNGEILHPQDWSDKVAGSIAAIEVIKRPTGETNEFGKPVIEYVHKYKAWDKVAALEKLGKHLGLFVEKLEIDVKNPIVIIERRIIRAANVNAAD